MTSRPLWPHQDRILEKVRASMSHGHRWILVQMATGAGKTTTATEICKAFVAKGKRVLWYAPRLELLDQAANELESAGLEVGCLHPGSDRVNPFRPVQVASIQTLQRRDLRPHADLVVADECRHYVSDKWKEVSIYYRSKGAYGIGLDATPVRATGEGLGEIYDDLIHGPPVSYLIEQGVLVPCEILAPRRPLEAGQIAQKPIDVYKRHANGRKTAIFASNVRAARDFAQEFNNAGIPCGIVTGEDSILDRRTTITKYRNGEYRVLASVNVLTEGWDDPATEVGILARSCGSVSLYLQIVGRLLRAHPGKQSALLLDLFGASRIWGPPEEPREYSLDGDGIKHASAVVLKWRFCPGCGALMRQDSAQCPECFQGGTGPELPEVVNVELEKFGWIRKDSPERKLERLAKWIHQCISDGHKTGRAYWKFKAVYNEVPSRGMWQQAVRMVDEGYNNESRERKDASREVSTTLQR